MDPLRQLRLDQAAAIGVGIEAETGVPASAQVTQWALESGWGAKPSGHANYFGIKKAARHSLCCTVLTHEVIDGRRVEKSLTFADYPDIFASFHDYAWLISNGEPYAAVWSKYRTDRDEVALIRGIAKIYATDPNYAELAASIAAEAPVVEAIQRARKATVTAAE